MHRLYENQDISVFWNSDKCRHARKCVTGCPKVFDFTRKPWIDLSLDETKNIWAAISKCPSGALDVTYNHEIVVKMDEENHRSIALDKDRIIGECDYRVDADSFTIYHTEVDPAYGGKKIAKRLVYKVIEKAERECIGIVPLCSYAAKVLE